MANEQAAVNSAPNASVTAQQPAQGSAAPAAGGLTAKPVAPQAAPQASQAASANVQQKDAAAASDLKDVRKDEQAKIDQLASVVESGNKDYFEQQEEFAKVFEEREGEDSFRRAARIERERDILASAGDPTRDPVAKQKAMDENTVQPGAVADAEKIKKTGAESVKKTLPLAGDKK